MNRFRLLAFLFAALCATSTPATAMPTLTVHVPYSIDKIAPAFVSISCGSFPAGAPPDIGARPLTLAYKRTTAPAAGTVVMTVPIAPAAWYVGCWPSTSTPGVKMDPQKTTRMVWKRLVRPLPPTIVMRTMTIVVVP